MPSLLPSGPRHKAHTPVQNEMCEQCDQKPKFIEPSGVRHPYCSRSCVKQAQGANSSPCALFGCRATGKPAFSNFCSEEHGRRAQAVRSRQVEGCDSCHENPRASGDLCMACDRKTPRPKLKELAAGSTLFTDIRTQFLSEWDSPNADRPWIDKVYQVFVPRDVRARYNTYCANERATEKIKVFYSAQCICDMGTKTPVLCDFKSCGICCTIKSSFNEFAFGERFNTGRFGEGIYSYRNPNLADVHATSATSTPYRVMIACDIAVQLGYQVPAKESVFVESADAIVPAFIIMYTV
ncbi:hypothetical protein MSAN_01329500 [Mycena sanguinolenta]|uniref:PARP catalytic domain-containing protein n=1 Tax=Mycena sanguinolenta TaxID=230812 RepID=A0A8H6YF29_9AGAR|nr:hypothetical protein MSAN_01329500 [Mycena sanguinolenta]